MITFEYVIEVREEHGYRPTLSDTLENEITIRLQAPNRVTADRMINSIIDRSIIVNISGVAIN